MPGAVVYFPGAFGVTEMRGIWQKAGADMIVWTVVGFAYDPAGTTVALARLSGKSAFSPDCNSETISDTFLEVFAPDANVETDDPIWTAPFPDHEGHRISIVTYDLPWYPAFGNGDVFGMAPFFEHDWGQSKGTE